MATDIDSIIAAAQARAQDLTDAAQSAAQGVPVSTTVNIPPYVTSVTPTLRGAPPAFTGNVDITTDILRAFQDGFVQFKPEMLEALADYIAKFFPSCVFTNTDNWICNTILYGGTGIPADVEAQIYQRAKAREYADASKQREAAVIQFAARGFNLPSGVLASRLLEVEQEADNKVSTFNRDIAIKQAELEIENIKFAVEQGVKIRASVIAAIADYVKAYLQPIELAIQRADAMARARALLLNSSADYYRAMVEEARLQLSAVEINSTSYNALKVAYMDTYQRANAANAQVGATVADALIAAASAANSSGLTLAAAEEQTINAA